MRKVGIELEGAKPQRLTPELAATANVLVTMACGEECLFISGVREDREIADPKDFRLERIRQIRDDVRARLAAFVTELR
jgi:arsenate reductase